MAKGIYNRLFDWLFVKCNMTLDARELQRVTFIGVLDIAGFEIFDVTHTHPQTHTHPPTHADEQFRATMDKLREREVTTVLQSSYVRT